MNNLLKLEEFGQLLLAILLFSQLDYAWWLFPACLLLPDLSMLGYTFGTKIGAFTYNIVHHKLLAIALFALGFYLHIPMLAFAGTILFGHAAMDRIFGYGLKYPDSFQHTHLGTIGKDK